MVVFADPLRSFESGEIVIWGGTVGSQGTAEAVADEGAPECRAQGLVFGVIVVSVPW